MISTPASPPPPTPPLLLPSRPCLLQLSTLPLLLPSRPCLLQLLLPVSCPHYHHYHAPPSYPCLLYSHFHPLHLNHPHHLPHLHCNPPSSPHSPLPHQHHHRRLHHCFSPSPFPFKFPNQCHLLLAPYHLPGHRHRHHLGCHSAQNLTNTLEGSLCPDSEAGSCVELQLSTVCTPPLSPGPRIRARSSWGLLSLCLTPQGFQPSWCCCF